MKYSEAEEQIKRLSDKYSIDMNGKDFCVVYDGKLRIAYVDGINKYDLHTNYGVFLYMPANDELFMILAHLAKTPLDKRVEEKKYLVKVFGEYLNVPIGKIRPFLFDGDDTENTKTCFNLYEIEQLKRRDDIPLDWKKVKLESAE